MKDTNTSTTEQHTDCLLGQGTYDYTPICQCQSCLVDPDDEDYSGFTDGPSDEEIEAITIPEQPYQPIETMTEDEYWESFTSNDRPW